MGKTRGNKGANHEERKRSRDGKRKKNKGAKACGYSEAAKAAAAAAHYGTKSGHFETSNHSLSHERGSEQSEQASERGRLFLDTRRPRRVVPEKFVSVGLMSGLIYRRWKTLDFYSRKIKTLAKVCRLVDLLVLFMFVCLM